MECGMIHSYIEWAVNTPVTALWLLTVGCFAAVVLVERWVRR